MEHQHTRHKSSRHGPGMGKATLYPQGRTRVIKVFLFYNALDMDSQLTNSNPIAQIKNVKEIVLTLGNSIQPVPISQHDPSEANKTLGVYIAPDVNEPAQEQYLTKQSHQIASLILTSNVLKHEAWMAYHLCWIPAIGYSLSTTTMSAKA